MSSHLIFVFVFIFIYLFTLQPTASNIFLELQNLQPSGPFESRGIGHLLVSQLARVQPSSTQRPKKPQRLPHFYCSSGGDAGLACVHGAVTLG
ncbi:hypothetical protein E4U43_000724 [Claviceps pusilla]|uniref:Secreted protein n=1 Tax=Claviceps pusilla TaxID=123648 RepID=A0A9P7N938_9HYPO|nr:hypothetical protein E4U43_000724 [Claviceps pusilla]